METYCDRCGEPLRDGGHGPCRTARLTEPPRYCTRCRRRMVVQVTPMGWTARCSEHGVLTSADTPGVPGAPGAAAGAG